MRVFNLGKQTIEEVPITELRGPCVWLVRVGKPIMCHNCRKFIGAYVQYVAYTYDFMGNTILCHMNCLDDNDMADGVVELLGEED